jgi:hypothetical protein
MPSTLTLHIIVLSTPPAHAWYITEQVNIPTVTQINLKFNLKYSDMTDCGENECYRRVRREKRDVGGQNM